MSKIYTDKFRTHSSVSLRKYAKPKFNLKGIYAATIAMTLFFVSACIPSPARVESTISSIPPVNKNLIVSIEGVAFHDYNGNGTKEYSEPVLPAMNLEFFNKETNQRFKIQTDDHGAYSYQLPTNKYQLILDTNVTGYNDQPFRYLYASSKEVKNIDELIYITINKKTTYNLALMQGFLTLPFSIVTDSYISTIFFDADRRYNFARDWEGNQETYDQHSGIDYRIPIGTPVIAAAPGQVLSSKYDPESGNITAIVHGFFITQYGHLNKIIVRAGDKVERGQQIGLSGASGKWVGKLPHLHFDLSEMTLPRIDIYRDITNPSSLSYWTVDNKPQYP
ncbi:M23 family metallopeptidase [Chloroflexota bacterium]